MLRRLILSLLIVTLSAHVVAAPGEREALAEKLVAHGVTPGEAQARVAALTDEEAAQLATTIDAAPAGGNKAFLAVITGVALVGVAILLAPFVIAGGVVYLAVKGSRAAA